MFLTLIGPLLLIFDDIMDDSSEEDVIVKVTTGTEVFQGPDIYELSPGLCRGQMLIVNFEEFDNKDHERVGSQKDVENLFSLFDQIGILIIRRRDMFLKIKLYLQGSM